MPEIGRPAPDFTLPHEPGGDPVHLAGFRGESNVVLLFLPLAWSSVCTRELCSVRPSGRPSSRCARRADRSLE
jgi:peroxiredoxin